jgi:hypothetical protein
LPIALPNDAYAQLIRLMLHDAKAPDTNIGLVDALTAILAHSHPLAVAYWAADDHDDPHAGVHRKPFLLRRLVADYRRLARATLVERMPSLILDSGEPASSVQLP